VAREDLQRAWSRASLPGVVALLACAVACSSDPAPLDLERDAPVVVPIDAAPNDARGVDTAAEADPLETDAHASPDADPSLGSDASTSADADARPRPTDTRPGATSPILIDGRRAHLHDGGSPAGWFHTYDDLAFGDEPPRKVHVLLPRDHGPGKRFPVVYIHDGDTTFWPGGAAGKSLRAQDRLSALYARAAIPHVIVVAIEPVDREREYTHRSVAPERSCCGLSGYTAWVADRLKPWIDAQYRTDPAARSTVVLGASHGGLAAFYFASVRRDRFGAAIAMSSSFWVGLDPIADDPDLARSRLLAEARSGLSGSDRPRFWLDWGLVREGGFHNSWIEERATARGREMAALLERDFGYVRGRDLFVREDPAGGHDEDAWSGRLESALIAILGR
jgi:enterochelin esterase-like enzyme